MKTAVAALACLGAFATSVDAGIPRTPTSTIASFVASSGSGFDGNPFDYDMLLKAVVTADLVAPLADPQARLTLWAPNDGAFIRLARDLGYVGTSESNAWDYLVDALTTLGGGDPIPVLRQVLLYHVAPTRINAIGFLILGIFGQPVTTLQGGTFQPAGFRIIDQEPDLADATLFVPLNVVTGNGIVHTVTRVLLPVNLP